VTDNDVVFVTTEEDLKARDEALQELGLTWEALKEQARTGSFVSERAHEVWDAFGELTPA
jgi:hypothetical protein